MHSLWGGAWRRRYRCGSVCDAVAHAVLARLREALQASRVLQRVQLAVRTGLQAERQRALPPTLCQGSREPHRPMCSLNLGLLESCTKMWFDK